MYYRLTGNNEGQPQILYCIQDDSSSLGERANSGHSVAYRLIHRSRKVFGVEDVFIATLRDAELILEMRSQGSRPPLRDGLHPGLFSPRPYGTPAAHSVCFVRGHFFLLLLQNAPHGS